MFRHPQRDLTAGLVVFLVALPLCLGIAEASDAPAFSGLLAGIVGGLVIGAISGSHTSVSGPAAGLTAVVAGQIAGLGSFEAFLLALTLAGVLQIVLGSLRAGAIAAFFPTAVIRGLLAAIGVILILKQVPHLFGHDTDPEGEMSFVQPDQQTTFSELYEMLGDLHLGPAVIGIGCFALLMAWERIAVLKRSPVPSALVVVAVGTAAALLFKQFGGEWAVGATHSVQVPEAANLSEFVGQLNHPDFSAIFRSDIYVGAFVIAAVASLETLLNLEAVDKIDPERRTSPPNRELVAQGCGNMMCGLIGGLPVTSVIIRSSVNLNMGVKTRLSALFHGVLLLGSALFLPFVINEIPLSCLAAVLLQTGLKLASPKVFASMWKAGMSQFLPFIVTVVAIVSTDLLIGIVVGLVVSFSFILLANVRLPLRRISERHLAGDVLRVPLPSQVTFLNRAALTRVFDGVESGGHVLIDATTTRYIDPDVLMLIREYAETTGPARGVQVSLVGFADQYEMEDRIQFVDHSSRDMQRDATPDQVLELLKEGNRRFRDGEQLSRDLARQKARTASGQFPLAVVVGCIDSRVPTELVFDLGLGDVFVTRVAGNVVMSKVLGGIEYATAIAGAKLCVVLGHTSCGAVAATIDFARNGKTAKEATGLDHLDTIVDGLRESLPDDVDLARLGDEELAALAGVVVRRNVERQVESIRSRSGKIAELEKNGEIKIVGAVYDVHTGKVDWL